MKQPTAAEEMCRVFMLEIQRWLGKPYRWGGQGQFSEGLDCSGLVVEGCRACGALGKSGDLNADGFWNRWKGHEIETPKFGALAFWFDATGRAYHVAVCIGPFHCITADGGGSTTKTLDDAERREAVIRYLPISHRKSKPRFVFPWVSSAG